MLHAGSPPVAAPNCPSVLPAASPWGSRTGIRTRCPPQILPGAADPPPSEDSPEPEHASALTLSATHPGDAHDLLVRQQADAHEAGLEAGFLPLHEVLPLQHGHVEGVGGGLVVHAHLHLAQREVLPEGVAHGRDGVEGVCRLGLPERPVRGQVQLAAHQLQGPQLADALKGVLDAQAAFATGWSPGAGPLGIPGRCSLGVGKRDRGT